GLLTALSVNLQSAALYYIDFIINDGLKVAHPWLLEAKKDLENQLS
ncbi:HD domain-containing protein, partial [Citrobacter sp. TBCS-11]